MDTRRGLRRSQGISRLRTLGIASGVMVSTTAPATMHVLINPVFNICLGISPGILSTLSFLQTMWYTAVCPWAGHLSDRLRTRRGRRQPVLAATCVPLALTFAAVWMFPAASSTRVIVSYLALASLLFYAVDAFYSTAVNALMLEAAPNYHDRTRLTFVVQLTVFVASIGVQWVFPFTQLAWFHGPLTGLRWFAVAYACIIAVGAAAPVVFSREAPQLTQRGSPHPGFRASVRDAFRNGPFVRVAAIRGIYAFSYNIISVLGLYLNYYLVFRGDVHKAAIMQGWNGTVFQCSAIASLFWFRRVALATGKDRALRQALLILIAGSAAKLVVYSPLHPWLQTIVYAANGAAGAGVNMLVGAILADVADYDEFRAGVRREGLYLSVLGWCERIGNSVGTLISGFLLVALGFNVAAGGHQAAFTLYAMKIAYFAFPTVGASAALLLLRKFRLDAAECYRIKAVLVARRNTAQSGLNPASPLPVPS